MDPPRKPREGGRQWFPRPRGDGPAPQGSRSWSRSVSPPTRGWTLARPQPQGARRGFPAHAGMDHALMSVWSAWCRFPRPRGDGPSVQKEAEVVNEVSPPTRGWTCVYESGCYGVEGFPAHAGMDRGQEIAKLRLNGFPRPRGDGPLTRKPKHRATLVSPPTRGWTHDGGPQTDPYSGFPAHAGMDLSCGPTSLCSSWFPRPRGDGPLDERRSKILGTVSPPTRGWTAPTTGPFRSSTVSPPTRGWTLTTAAYQAGSLGFPAHAGMDLVGSRPHKGGTGFPRPRGDGPSSLIR